MGTWVAWLCTDSNSPPSKFFLISLFHYPIQLTDSFSCSTSVFQQVIIAIIHAGIIYFLPMFAFTRIYDRGNGEIAWVDTPIQMDGESGGLYVLGTAIYVCLIFSMHWKVMWHTYSWTWVTALFMLGFSFPLFILFFIVYSNWMDFAPQFFGVSLQVFNNATLWLSALLVLTCIAILEYVKERIRTQFFPTAIDIAMELDRGFSMAKKQGILDGESLKSDAVTHETASDARRSSLLSPSDLRSNETGHTRIWSNLEDADQMSTHPLSSPSNHVFTGKHMSSEKRRQSHLEQAMNIEDARKTNLGLSLGRHRDTSYAFDHPSRELGMAGFDSADWSTMTNNGNGNRISRGRADSARASSNSRTKTFGGTPPLSSSNLKRSRSVESRQVSLSSGISKEV